MAPKSIQDKITEKFIELAEQAGLEFITSGSYWLIMDDRDGLDTRLRIKRTFGPDNAAFELAGQAVDRPGTAFFRERKLIRKNVGASNRSRLVIELRAAYGNGEALRKIFGAVHDLLAPYAVRPLSAMPQIKLRLSDPQEPGLVVSATRATPKDGDPDAELFVLVVPEARSGPSSARTRTLDHMSATAAASMAGAVLGNVAVGRELIEQAREHGWAQATVGGAHSSMLPRESGAGS
jgi:hypothetical protein